MSGAHTAGRAIAAFGPLIVERPRIVATLSGIDLVPLLEAAFDAHSQGRAQVTPVGELLFDEPPGDAHIKSGHIAGDAYFVVKVATGFYRNPARGLPSSSGLMLLFDAATGAPAAILLDEGALTDERTAAAGAVAAKWCLPEGLAAIGIIGAGIQARLQLARLRQVTPCRKAVVWARRPEGRAGLAAEAASLGFEAAFATSPAEVAARSRLIVTTTPASEPLLLAADVAPGTHITAVGADTTQKGELAADLLARADTLVADSVGQCRERGELRRASAGARIVELGDVIGGRALGRRSAADITLADFTGLAVQDAAIAQAVFAALRQRPEAAK